MRSGMRLALFPCLVLALDGCALTSGHVRLEAARLTVPVTTGAGREVIIFPAEDQRSDVHRCGVKRNTYGSETANVYCEPPPAQWLSEVVLRSVDKAGFKVVTTQTAKSPDPLRLRLTLNHLFVDQVPGFVTVSLLADVHVTITAETSTGLSAERSFCVRGERDVPAVIDAGLQSSFDQAAQSLADEIVLALVELAKTYPSSSPAVASVPSEPGNALALREGAP
jgi:hypothetical protein